MPSGITILVDDEIKEDKEVKEDGQEEGEILEAEHVEAPRKMSVLFPGINAPIPNNADERIWTARPSNSDPHRKGGGPCANYSSEASGRHREHTDRDDRYPSRCGDDFSSPENTTKIVPASRSPNSERSIGDRNDLPNSEDSFTHRSYSSYLYGSSRRFQGHTNDLEGCKGDQPDYSSRGWDREDRYRLRRV